MKKYDILLFDLDDTLIDNTENIRHAFKVMLDYMGDTYSDDKFNRWSNLDKQFWIDRKDGKIIVPEEYKEPLEKKVRWIRSQRYILYFNNDITLDKAMEINDLYLNALNEIVLPIDGAKETLEYLSKKYIIAVATNGPSVATTNKVRKIGCEEYIDHIFAADMFGYMKPSTIFFDGVKEALGELDSNKYLMIGDSLKTDVYGASRSNMDSCWFDRDEEILTNEDNPTIIIKKLTDLKNYL